MECTWPDNKQKRYQYNNPKQGVLPGVNGMRWVGARDAKWLGAKDSFGG